MKGKLKSSLITKLVAGMVCIVIVACSVVQIAVLKTNKTEMKNLYKTTVEEAYKLAYELFDAQNKGSWYVSDGQLYKGENLISGNDSFANEIFRKTGYHVTICMDGKRVSTSITDEKGVSVVGSEISSEVNEIILAGDTYSAEADVYGTMMMTHYEPVKDLDGKIVGAFFIGAYEDSLNQILMKCRKAAASVQMVCTIIAIAIVIIVAIKIVKPINRVCSELEKISDKDFSEDNILDGISHNDERGKMVMAVKNMKSEIRDMLMIIAKEADKMGDAAVRTNERVMTLNENVEEVSASTEEISAAMEETAAGAEEVETTVNNISDSVEALSGKAEEGNDRANDIYDRAINIKNNALKSREKAIAVIQDSKQRMEKAIEASKSIEEISILADTILGIADQTNLLSLNASIEAARAGEVGRGFAVVANEIKNLSNASGEAVEKIQIVVKEVFNTVENLVKVSREITEFVDENVMQAYDTLLMTGETYEEDADYIKQFANDLNTTAQEVTQTILKMGQTIDEMVIAIEESANGSTSIAGKTGEIALGVNEVLAISQETRTCSEELKERVEKFSF